MLDYKSALNLIISSAEPLPLEKVALQQSLKRVLAASVYYDMDMPPFDKSAMDGYACRRADLNNELVIVETVYAGKLPENKIKENQCSKIMTGAVVPEGADCVFKKEDARILDDNKVICINPATAGNICYRGEDIKSGEKILEKPLLITSKHLPVLAGAGIVNPVVYCRPDVTVFATGTELVEPDVKPMSYQIRNSNSSQLLAQLSELNISARYGGIIRDEQAVLTEILSEAFKASQGVILTGGVSVGDFDLIPEVLVKMDFEILITATAIKPGKPMVFARKGAKYCFGLSGNPVSSFVQFELYVKPFLFSLMGLAVQPELLQFPVGAGLNRKNADRLNFIPVVLTPEMEVMPLEFHGSAHINGLAEASHLLEFPTGVNYIKKGEMVNVRSI